MQLYFLKGSLYKGILDQMRTLLKRLIIFLVIIVLSPLESQAKIQAEINIGISDKLISDFWIPIDYTIVKNPGFDITGKISVRNLEVDWYGNVNEISAYSHPIILKKDDTFPNKIKIW